MRRAVAAAIVAGILIAQPVQAQTWPTYRERHIGHPPQVLAEGLMTAQSVQWLQDRDHLQRHWKAKVAAIAVVSAVALTAPAPAPAPQQPVGAVQQIICDVFGSYCSEALSVAACESGYNVNAVNGQYLGIFQMGESERATYGHGPDARTQARAAYAYFVAAGSDWSPWTCKP